MEKPMNNPNITDRVTFHIEGDTILIGDVLNELATRHNVAFTTVYGHGIYAGKLHLMTRAEFVQPCNDTRDLYALARAIERDIRKITGETCVMPVIDTVSYVCTCDWRFNAHLSSVARA